MRSPRPKQRFPGGGKELYELLRMDYEPEIVQVFPLEEITADRAKMRATLTFHPEFDPMLYFWPVESMWVIVQLKAVPHEDLLKRLAKAFLRDGALFVSVIWSVERTAEERELGAKDWLTKPVWKNFGDFKAYEARHAAPVAPPA